MQYMNWGGKCSPERLMQFSYFTWTTAFCTSLFSGDSAHVSLNTAIYSISVGRSWPANMTSFFGSVHRSFHYLKSPFNPKLKLLSSRGESTQIYKVLLLSWTLTQASAGLWYLPLVKIMLVTQCPVLKTKKALVQC